MEEEFPDYTEYVGDRANVFDPNELKRKIDEYIHTKSYKEVRQFIQLIRFSQQRVRKTDFNIVSDIQTISPKDEFFTLSSGYYNLFKDRFPQPSAEPAFQAALDKLYNHLKYKAPYANCVGVALGFLCLNPDHKSINKEWFDQTLHLVKQYPEMSGYAVMRYARLWMMIL